jgi:TolB-like protein
MRHSGHKGLKPIIRFFHELSRRSVIRVGIAYLLGAWLLIEASSVVLPSFGLPDTSIRIVILLAALGLPVALLLSWIFDLTPDGVVRSDFVADEQSLAVLAFADRSPEKNQEYLAEGLSEELINILGKIEGLNLTARSSAFSFKGENRDVREIGRQLNVAAVLDGSVRESQDQLRISAELIDVASGYCLWTNTYGRAVDEVFKIQDDISRCIVRELKPAFLNKNSESVLVDPGTENHEAYRIYLKGRFYWNSRYAVGLERGIEYFKRAVVLDADFALPWSGLADSYSLLAFHNVLAPKIGFQLGREAADRAMELGPDLAESNASDAFIKAFYDWDFPAAEASYCKAITNNPRYGPARLWFSLMLAGLGRVADSRVQMKKAKEAEPFSASINGSSSYMDFFFRRHETGIATAKEVLAMDPNFGPAYMFLGFNCLAIDRPEEAVTYWRKALEREERMVLSRLMLACALARANDRPGAMEMLATVDNAQAYVPSYFRAALDLALGEREAALASLEMALEERSNFLVMMGMDALFDELHSEPRFLNILERVGVPLQTAESHRFKN